MRLDKVCLKKKFCYLAYYDPLAQIGVHKKLYQTVEVLNGLGYEANVVAVTGRGGLAHFNMLTSLIKIRADIVLIRCNIALPLLVLPIIWKRLRGVRIIIEVPTPNSAGLHEIINNSSIGRLGKITRIAATCIAFPWSLFPANKVIQYAPESGYFSLGIKKITQLHSNGISNERVAVRKMLPPWPANEFVMIAVAQLAAWHAFDRVIQGIAEFRNKYGNACPAPRFVIVGEGVVRDAWIELAENLGVGDRVDFVGAKRGEELDELFEKAHVAFSSLGLFRKNLEMASDLKSREYTARGIPFVSAGSDIDFDPPPFFVYKVENNGASINIASIISWYAGLGKDGSIIGKMRSYSEEKLDFKIKVIDLIN